MSNSPFLASTKRLSKLFFDEALPITTRIMIAITTKTDVIIIDFFMGYFYVL
jgi:hypothetical protein